ncbi:alkene reductase [Paraferrimonas haliotis]|uniref:Alkene reductase n=2 Tax=Paraferrimonas haliotis TaxID=2013866 RepID=A0AA37WXD3_9GAMM|nr:alkene reductase [Paraferrimonas haliotis]
MTRARTTQPGNVPNALMARYYQQRASAGLIITEGAPVSAAARGYSLTPGIYQQAHIDGWRLITEAIHQQGGKVFVQLWHVGRRGHSRISGAQPLAPSALKVADKVYGPLGDGGFGMIETQVPKAMDRHDIERTQQEFVQATRNAMEANFDGVEIHGAHGYLFDSFMRMSSNKRDDDYGGSQQNRIRMLVETTQRVVNAVGADKVGVRISPHLLEKGGHRDPEMADLTIKLLQALEPLGLAYVHFSENPSNDESAPNEFRCKVRQVFSGQVMLAGGHTDHSAQSIIEQGLVDFVAFGTAFISNPDLVERFSHNWPLATLTEQASQQFYGGDDKGYCDYPSYQASIVTY